MTTVGSISSEELFIVPSPGKKVRVLTKDIGGKIRVSRGPDHHGRIIYGQVVDLSPDTIVQPIHKWTVNGFLT